MDRAIADRTHLRQGLELPRPGDEMAVGLRTLTARCLGLVNEHPHQTDLLREQLP